MLESEAVAVIRSQAVGQMAWQLPRVQTVYGCNVTAIAISHSISQ